MDAKVIGVVVSKSRSAEAIGFCIPAADLASFMSLQAQSGYAISPRVIAEHDARATIKAMFHHTLEFEVFIDHASEVIQDRSNQSAAELASAEFVQFVKSYIEKENPELERTFAFSSTDSQ